jgi:endonuclease IV
MIHYGIKLWLQNEPLFQEAVDVYRQNKIHFIELYNNPEAPLNFNTLAALKALPVTIHHTNSHGWHELAVGPEQLTMWANTVELANYFAADKIIVHPGQARDITHLNEIVNRIDDQRMLLENMAGLDIKGNRTFGRTLAELEAVRKLKPICFDFEKAVKSAAFQKINYQEFIVACLDELKPNYFHISGGDKNSPIDEHANLWEANFDIGWIRDELMDRFTADDCRLVFETPKNSFSLENDLKNIDFFNQA